MKKIVLSAQNLFKSYDHTQAVDDLTLEISEGEFFGFLGPNGAGKTTTIRMLTGMIPPDRGTISINGLPIGKKDEISRIIGVMPESRGFYEWMTGEEYLAFFAQLYSMPSSTENVDKLLNWVSLTERKKRKIGTYSRGMKQRLGLARALINSPKILFLDEPTLGLDPKGQEDIQKLLLDLNKQGTTIFFSSHLLHEVSMLCSRIAIINRGKVVASGSIADLQHLTHKKDGDLKDIFLSLTNSND